MDTIDECILFDLTEKEFMKFGTYFFRGFLNKGPIKKYLRATYRNFQYNRKNKEICKKTGVDPRMVESLIRYKKMKGKKEYIDNYKLVENGLITIDEEYKLSIGMRKLMTYCYLNGVEEIPLIDTMENYHKFRCNFHTYEEVEEKYKLDQPQTLDDDFLFIYINPKLFKRLKNDSDLDSSNIEVEKEFGDFLTNWEYENEFTLLKLGYLIKSKKDFQLKLLRNKKINDFLNTDYCSTCSICLESNKDPEKMISKLSCDHIYHKECIFKMFQNITDDGMESCPLCRKSIYIPKIDNFYIDYLL